MNEFDHIDQPDVDPFLLEIIGQMWEKVAGDIYRQYQKRGRGVLALFLMKDFPPGMKEFLPDNTELDGHGFVGTYIPRDKLLPLEEMIGEQGLLSIDRQLGEYDPEKTIVFAFFGQIENDEGGFGTRSTGLSATPQAPFSPRAMAEKSQGSGSASPFSSNKRYNPKINLN